MKNKGFTFIEILVVVTIIAMLVMVAAVSYGSINKRSRDAKRKSDIEQIRSALEMYRADNGYYPDGPISFATVKDDATLTNALFSYLPSIPPDPKDDTEYPYKIIMTDSRGTPAQYYGYCLAAFTEATGSDSNSCGVTLPDSLTSPVKPYTYGVKNP